MRIAMIGTGYVGLVSGACFSDFGHHVTCVDKDAGKIAALRRGEIPIFEPGLDALVASNVKAGRLDFATDLAAVEARDLVAILVHAGDLVAEIGKAGARNQPHIARANHGNSHETTRPSMVNRSEFAGGLR